MARADCLASHAMPLQTWGEERELQHTLLHSTAIREGNLHSERRRYSKHGLLLLEAGAGQTGIVQLLALALKSMVGGSCFHQAVKCQLYRPILLKAQRHGSSEHLHELR